LGSADEQSVTGSATLGTSVIVFVVVVLMLIGASVVYYLFRRKMNKPGLQLQNLSDLTHVFVQDVDRDEESLHRRHQTDIQ
jgi:hypothetical protein